MSESPLRGPEVVPFVECPNCERLLEYGTRACPSCREEIDSNYALTSAAVVYLNTQACSLANSIKGLDSFVWIALAGSLLIYAIDWYAFGRPALFYLTVAWAAIPLLVIAGWFYRFGWFRIGDAEYARARRYMRGSLLLWLAVLGLQLIILYDWNRQRG